MESLLFILIVLYALYVSVIKARPQFRAFFLSVTTVFVAITIFASGLALLGYYSLPLLLCCLALTSIISHMVILYIHRKERIGNSFQPVYSPLKIVLIWMKQNCLQKCFVSLLFIGLFVFYSTFSTNYLHGGRDYGVYMIHGAHISQTGGISYADDAFLQENTDITDALISPGYPGIFDAREFGESDTFGDLDPQFLIAFPAVLAIGFDLGGIDGMLMVNSVITILALMCVYAFSYIVTKRHSVALLATLFMAFSPAQIWGARITQSEQLAQVLFLLVSIYFFIGWRDKNAGNILVAATLLGAASFCRIDNYLLFIPVYGIACYTFIKKRDYARSMFGAAIIQTIMGGLALVYTFAFHRNYFSLLWKHGSLRMLIIACGCSFLLTLVIRFWTLKKKQSILDQTLTKIQKHLHWKSICIAVVFFVVSMFVLVPALFPGNFSANSLIEFSWYISPLMIFLSIAGFFFMSFLPKWRHLLAPLSFFLIGGVLSVLLYSMSPSIYRDHFWASRRWIPVNYPFLSIMAAFALVVFVVDWGKKYLVDPRHRFAASVLSVIMGLTMIMYMVSRSDLVMTKSYFAEIEKQYDELVDLIADDNRLILMDTSEPAPFSMAGYASVLRFVYNEPAYMLTTKRDEEKEESLRTQRNEAINKYLESHESVIYVGTPLQFLFDLDISYVGRTLIGDEFPEPTMGSFPEKTVPVIKEMVVWELRQTTNSAQDILEMLSLSQTARRTQNGVETEAAGVFLYGPYVSLLPGTYTVTGVVDGDNTRYSVQVLSENKEIIQLEDVSDTEFSVTFTVEKKKKEVEIVLTNLDDSRISCCSLAIKKLSTD